MATVVSLADYRARPRERRRIQVKRGWHGTLAPGWYLLYHEMTEDSEFRLQSHRLCGVATPEEAEDQAEILISTIDEALIIDWWIFEICRPTA